MGAQYLFDGMQSTREMGPNDLTPAQRNALVTGVIPLCKKLAREHAHGVTQAGGRCDVEELAAEAMVAACEAAVFYRPVMKTSQGDRAYQFTTLVGLWVRTHLKACTDPRRHHTPGEVEFPERLASREDGPEEPVIESPDEDQARLLRGLTEPGRTIARLSVFEGLTPSRIAAQLDMPLKDVKLIMRNSAAALARLIERDAGPNLWTANGEGDE